MKNIKDHSPMMVEIINQATKDLDKERVDVLEVVFALVFEAGRASGMDDLNSAVEKGAAMEESKSHTIH